MIIDILTLFPEIFTGIIESSIIKRAKENGFVSINIHDFREYSNKPNKRVDDYSYGGGAGMIISVQPIVDCLKQIPNYDKAKKILTTPSGIKYDQSKAFELAKEEHIIIVCGHYEGIDDRITHYIDEEISIGDYILTGGEIAALAIFDSITRLIPGVLGNEESTEVESFDEGLLEYPQYTRPQVYDNYKVPDVLISGHHENIRNFRHKMSLKKTYEKRKDLLDKLSLNKEDLEYIESLKQKKDLDEYEN